MTLADYAREGRTLDHIPVFDVHSHAGRWAIYDAIGREDTLAEMDRIGIDVMAVSGLAALAGEFRRGNDEVAEWLALNPDRFVGYAHVSAVYPEQMLPELERCFAQPGFKGIKVYQVGVAYDDPRFEPVWAFAAARRLPVLAHTWAGNLTGLDAVAPRWPQASFLVAHTGSGLAYKPYIEAARKAPNVYLDLTYSREHPNLIEHLVAQVGADRIVWGTDAPIFSMAHQTAKVLTARIPDADKEKILYHTAARLFQLGA